MTARLERDFQVRECCLASRGCARQAMALIRKFPHAAIAILLRDARRSASANADLFGMFAQTGQGDGDYIEAVK